MHYKILTLLALSPTYSYDLEKLRSELNWNEQRHGSFHTYLCSIRHDGKQLYALTGAFAERSHLALLPMFDCPCA